jgi:hypothetical protein
MKLTMPELEFLSAWAREEWEPECYRRPAHRLQLAHRVTGAFLIELIKAWTQAEGKKDQDILQAAANPNPSWPWSAAEQFRARLEEARTERAHRASPAASR